MTKVMISSSLLDLEDARKAIIDSCNRFEFQPIAMEHEAAANSDVVEKSLAMVEEADWYILVIGYRYGSSLPGDPRSITEIEYDRAVTLGKNRLLFLMSEEYPLTRSALGKANSPELLERFTTKARQDRVPSYFSNVTHLQLQVEKAFRDHIDVRPKQPVQFTGIPVAPKPYIAHPYSLLESSTLIGRRQELEVLSGWAKDAETPILAVQAMGGMGKSALTWSFFNSQIKDGTRHGFDGAMWWSFYEHSAYFSNFLAHLYCYCFQCSLEDARKKSWSDLEEPLLQSLAANRFLVVLDGFERELNQYVEEPNRQNELEGDSKPRVRESRRKGLLQDDAAQNTRKKRSLNDSRAAEFLQKLAAMKSSSRILISTRLHLADLETRDGRPRPGVKTLNLCGLEDGDAFLLWESYGMRGSPQSLRGLFQSIDGHPLVIQAAAAALADYPPANRDYDQYILRRPDFNPSADLPLLQRHSHILSHAVLGLSELSRQVFQVVALFRKPPTYAVLDHMLRLGNGPVKTEDDLIAALADLADRGLIGRSPLSNRFDMHPVIRNIGLRSIDHDALTSNYEMIREVFEDNLDNTEGALGDDVAGDEGRRLESKLEIMNAYLKTEQFDDAFDFYESNLADFLHSNGMSTLAQECLAPLFKVTRHGSGVSSKLLSPDHQRMGSLCYAYAVARDCQFEKALRLFEYHNSLCREPICLLHQTNIYSISGYNVKVEELVKSVLDSLKAEYWIDLEDKSDYWRAEYAATELKFLSKLYDCADDREDDRLCDYITRRACFIIGSGLDIDVTDNTGGFIAELALGPLKRGRRHEEALSFSQEMTDYFSRAGNSGEALSWREHACDAKVGLGLLSEAFGEIGDISREYLDTGNTLSAVGCRLRQARILAKLESPAEALNLLGVLDDRFTEMQAHSYRIAAIWERAKILEAQGEIIKVVALCKQIVKLYSPPYLSFDGTKELNFARRILREYDAGGDHDIELSKPLDWISQFEQGKDPFSHGQRPFDLATFRKCILH
ncbi:hypothetical protein CWS35_06235 [Bradyrhizobium sp. SK17]|nr:hypothetical protein CWS35_06235 [Bradyrhizobium sp. SK17]